MKWHLMAYNEWNEKLKYNPRYAGIVQVPGNVLPEVINGSRLELSVVQFYLTKHCKVESFVYSSTS